MAHARALVNVEDIDLHLEILHAVIDRHLSVHQTEDMVKNAKKKPVAPTTKKRGELPATHVEAQGRLKKKLQSTVEIKRSQRGKGSMTIYFNSDEDFNRILQLIEK